MSRFIPVDPEKWAAMVKAQSDLVRYKEMCDELDAECTRLKAEVERLTKAGNQSIAVGTKLREMVGDHHWSLEFDRVRTDWNAVKGGQPTP